MLSCLVALYYCILENVAVPDANHTDRIFTARVASWLNIVDLQISTTIPCLMNGSTLFENTVGP